MKTKLNSTRIVQQFILAFKDIPKIPILLNYLNVMPTIMVVML